MLMITEGFDDNLTRFDDYSDQALVERLEEDEVRGRYEYEIQARVDQFVDEFSVRHNAFPDSDDETDSRGDRNGKQREYQREYYEGSKGDGNLKQGQSFYNGVEFKDAVLDYALRSGRNIKQYRYDKTKLGFQCAMDSCPWRVYCSVVGKTDRWEIKILKGDHSCIPNGECEMLKSPVIARLFLDQIREEPDYMMPMKIEEIIKVRWKITSTRHQCQAARNSALRWIAKEYADQFAHIRDYGAEILESNPGSTVDIETVRNEAGEDVFARFYVCFDKLRKAWKETCRRLIGVDGCFLKTRLKGQLLVAIGRDGDNKIYPIAWAIVQVENTENWCWFVRKLNDDLGLVLGVGHILISDRQKGLLKAVELELPYIEHRMCVRHIYANLKSRHGKKPEMKKLLWILAWSYNEADYAVNLEEIRQYDIAVYDDIMRSKPRTWCRAFQKTGSCCEDVENNSTESFNNTIGRARVKPYVPMLETLRRLAMERIAKRSIIANGYIGQCTPYATRFLEAEHERASKCKIYRSTHGMYEVVISGCSYKVCLERRTCSCRKWEVTGIPCEHAYAVIMEKTLPVHEYVAHWFHTATLKKTYADSIEPMRGARFWMRPDTSLVHEPEVPNQPGRKKNPTKAEMKRKRGRNESPTKKPPTEEATTEPENTRQKKRLMHCRVCGEEGHNSRRHKNDKNDKNDNEVAESQDWSITDYNPTQESQLDC